MHIRTCFVNNIQNLYWKITIYQNLMKRKGREFERNIELRFNDKQFSSLLQLKKWKHTRTGYIPREVFFNYNNEETIKDVIINTEKTRSKL